MAETLQLSVNGLEPEFVAEVERLANERGSALSLDELVKLYRAAEQCRAAFRGGQDDAGDQSGLLWRRAEVGGVTLWAPTIAARIILERIRGWIDDGAIAPGIASDMLVAYALAHAKDAEGLARVNCKHPAQCEGVVREWATALTCYPEDLQAAFDDLVDGAFPQVPGAQKKTARPGE